MSHQKKILISLPDSLLSEADSLATARSLSRSEFVRKAMRTYIHEAKKAEISAMLKKGYCEMAEINIEIADYCFEADNIQQQIYEEKLAECE